MKFSTTKDRLDWIIQRRTENWTLERIGQECGITRERVRQLISQNAPELKEVDVYAARTIEKAEEYLKNQTPGWDPAHKAVTQTGNAWQLLPNAGQKRERIFEEKDFIRSLRICAKELDVKTVSAKKYMDWQSRQPKGVYPCLALYSRQTRSWASFTEEAGVATRCNTEHMHQHCWKPADLLNFVKQFVLDCQKKNQKPNTHAYIAWYTECFTEGIRVPTIYTLRRQQKFRDVVAKVQAEILQEQVHA